jgi:hypothetical protein
VEVAGAVPDVAVQSPSLPVEQSVQGTSSGQSVNSQHWSQWLREAAPHRV